MSESQVVEKRKRGRPRKNPLPQEPPLEILTPEEAAGMEPRGILDEDELAALQASLAEETPLPEDDDEPSVLGAGVGEQPLPEAPPVATPPVQEPTELPPGFHMGRRAQTLGEIYEGVARYATKVEKVAWLRYNAVGSNSHSLWYTIALAFQEPEWLLPEGLPPYKQHKGRPGSAPSELKRELRRIYVFLKGGGDLISPLKRQKVFQQVLEGLDANEVLLLTAIKDRKVPQTFGLTKEVVEAAFPGLLQQTFPLKFIR